MTLESIRHRLEAATPGPWKVVGGDIIGPIYSHTYGCTSVIFTPEVKCDHCEKWTSFTDYLRPTNLQFIAHAPTDIARLLAFVEPIVELVAMFRGEGVTDISVYGPKLIAAYEALERGDDE